MTTLVNYLTAFWSVVVVNCVQPVNWEYCKNVDDWLIPGIKEGIHLYMNPSSILFLDRGGEGGALLIFINLLEQLGHSENF